MPGLRHVIAAALLVLFAGAPPLAAQQAAPDQTAQMPFVTVDQDRLFTQSAWGKRVQAGVDAASAKLESENRKIEAALTAEEKALTERRSALSPEEFRKLADEFDSRVTGIRQAQEDKARAINVQFADDRQAFFQAALPVMGEVMRARGAVAVLDSRAIFLSVRTVDATDDMIARLDQELGDRPATAPETTEPPPPQPPPEPPPAPPAEGQN